MIYELSKFGYEYMQDTYKPSLLGFIIEVIQTNKYKEKGKDLQPLLSNKDNANYYKISEKKYKAYVFKKDFIDSDEKLHDYFMKIVYFLINNYSNDLLSSKLKDFFQDESGYYLIIDERESEIFPEDIKNPEILKNIFIKLNKEFEMRHKFGIYDATFYPLQFDFLLSNENKNEIKPILMFENFLWQLEFKFSGHVFSEIELENVLSPEIFEKINKVKMTGDLNEDTKNYQEITFNINEKNELYNIGRAMRYLMTESIDGDLDEIEDNKLKNLIENLIKENPEERLTWEKYINHPFFQENNIKKDYKYEIIKKVYSRGRIQNIITLKNNIIIAKEKPGFDKYYLHIINEKYENIYLHFNREGKYLFNVNELILIDFIGMENYQDKSKTDNEICLYQLNKENIDSSKIDKEKDKFSLENEKFLKLIQRIKIDYDKILPLSNQQNDLIISLKSREITFWKFENMKYKEVFRFKPENPIFGLLAEIKSINGFAAWTKKEGKNFDYRERKFYLVFYDFFSVKREKILEKKIVEIKCEPEEVMLINDKVLAIRDTTNELKLIDINNFEIFKKILLETTSYSFYVNKYKKILVNMIYESGVYSYYPFTKEYYYENSNLIRSNTLKNRFYILKYSENEKGNIIFGTYDGEIIICN